MASLQALRDILVMHRFSVVDDPKRTSDRVPKWSRLPDGRFMLHRDYVVRTPEEAMALLSLYLEDKLGARVASTVGRERELLESEKLPLREIGSSYINIGGVDMHKLNFGSGVKRLAFKKAVEVGCGGANVDLTSAELHVSLLATGRWDSLPMHAIAASDLDNSNEGQEQNEQLIQQLNTDLETEDFGKFLKTLQQDLGTANNLRDPIQAYLLARRLALRRGLQVSQLEPWSVLLYKLVMDSDRTPAQFCDQVNDDWLKFLETKAGKGSPPAKKALLPNMVIEDGWAGALVHGLTVSAAFVGLAVGYVPPKTVSYGLKAFKSEGVPQPARTLEVLLNERLDKAEALLSWWAKGGDPIRDDWNLPLEQIVTKLILQ